MGQQSKFQIISNPTLKSQYPKKGCNIFITDVLYRNVLTTNGPIEKPGPPGRKRTANTAPGPAIKDAQRSLKGVKDLGKSQSGMRRRTIQSVCRPENFMGIVRINACFFFSIANDTPCFCSRHKEVEDL